MVAPVEVDDGRPIVVRYDICIYRTATAHIISHTLDPIYIESPCAGCKWNVQIMEHKIGIKSNES